MASLIFSYPHTLILTNQINLIDYRIMDLSWKISCRDSLRTVNSWQFKNSRICPAVHVGRGASTQEKFVNNGKLEVQELTSHDTVRFVARLETFSCGQVFQHFMNCLWHVFF